ncbi:MAG TPA: DUF2254 domain-containing protein [Scandinavium sp.]|jgi:uncharacterized membrane protein|uniref:DUF2254 domain-containing protein n=1 Tax=Scandinavium sp. TaxID=2830653 RepID=UPI002E381C32|nr:DUF2254 domain-containing protein [Scandinavium sp.]HEX4500134.1 DUF2254 domain-containing protein [Scandinavium sp.]
MSKWQWLFNQLTRQLWFRISLFAVLAVLSALSSIALKPFIPASVGGIVGAEAVDNILNILASSMLAVTTFSLSIMVSAYSSASTSVTPRATRLMMEDSVTQNVLATFIGSFLFSLVGIVARSMGAYGEQGRVVLFITTLVVITLMIIMLLRWIQHLSLLGRVGETTLRVEEATRSALENRVNVPYMGGNLWTAPPKDALPLYPAEIGYIQNIDVAMLNEFAVDKDVQLYLPCQIGAFIHPAQAIVWLTPARDDIETSPILDAITIHAERSFDQDPRFGLSVLAEIASRALSPAVNDPGTAIDVTGRAVRLLAICGEKKTDGAEVLYPQVFVKPLLTADLFDDIFNPIARDGAALIEVQMRLAKSLQALAQLNPEEFAADARRYLVIILAWAETKMESPPDRQRITTWIKETGLLR